MIVNLACIVQHQHCCVYEGDIS